MASAIASRRSAAAFAPSPLSLRDLGAVVTIALGSPPLERAPGVELFVVAHRVSGLAAGVYHCGRESLAPILTAELEGPLVRACLNQPMAGSAAAGLVMAAELVRPSLGLGDRNYRDLLLESGGIAQRIYLAAESQGLVARNLAAFIDDRFNELVGLSERGLAALHLTMLGHGS